MRQAVQFQRTPRDLGARPPVLDVADVDVEQAQHAYTRASSSSSRHVQDLVVKSLTPQQARSAGQVIQAEAYHQVDRGIKPHDVTRTARSQHADVSGIASRSPCGNTLRHRPAPGLERFGLDRACGYNARVERPV